MFYSCCIMHNMLLHFDGLDVRWEQNVNYLSNDGHHSHEDMLIFRQHLSRVLIGTATVQNRFGIVHGDNDVEYEHTYINLQKNLIDHFAWKYSIYEIQWLKKKSKRRK